uniref:Uncharacterized protein n=1 Tax=Arundo donax TaxID=35708 RepID=A0A0A8YUJ7_ARUDO
MILQFLIGLQTLIGSVAYFSKSKNITRYFSEYI